MVGVGWERQQILSLLPALSLQGRSLLLPLHLSLQQHLVVLIYIHVVVFH